MFKVQYNKLLRRLTHLEVDVVADLLSEMYHVGCSYVSRVQQIVQLSHIPVNDSHKKL